jgi:hypothetical protein
MYHLVYDRFKGTYSVTGNATKSDVSKSHMAVYGCSTYCRT